jgi:UDP-N-acetylglucosamine 2-epimerase (non-hydrolysing)
MKIFIIFGTRPEAIKLAPLIWELKKNPRNFDVKVCLTGQHKEMLTPFLKNFDLNSNYNLKVMKKNQTLSALTSKIVAGLETIFKKEKPDWIIVQGDTISAFLASLAAYYQKIKIIHLEAGLRTNDKYNPFPEEINRRLITHLADIHLTPTNEAKSNLLKEGIDNKKIFVVGNTVIDTLLWINKKIKNKDQDKKIKKFLKNKFNFCLDNKRLILVTSHRRESLGSDLENICLALKKISLLRQDINILYAVHLNPHVQKTVHRILKDAKGVYLTPPLDYFNFVWLMNKSYLILTDSGGIQEEAPSFKKPLLVMRKKTERTEGIKTGVAKLVGVNKNNIVKNTLLLLDNKKKYEVMKKNSSPYGNGLAAKKIIKILKFLK